MTPNPRSAGKVAFHTSSCGCKHQPAVTDKKHARAAIRNPRCDSCACRRIFACQQLYLRGNVKDQYTRSEWRAGITIISMRPGFILPASLVGTVAVFISSHAQAFLLSGRPSLVQASDRLHGAGKLTSVPKSPRSTPLMVSNQDGVLQDEFGIPIYDENGEINEDQLDDYQRNPDGLKEGDLITIVGKGLRFYHLRQIKDEEGFDPEGCVGEISNLYIMSKKYEGEFSTAHRPVVCTFTQPYKFKAHMEFGEVRKSTPEEVKKLQEQVAAQNALDEAEAAKRNAARAKEAAEAEAAAKAAE